MESNSLELDGGSLTISKLMKMTIKTQITLSQESWNRVYESRKIVEQIASGNEAIYAINTGVGSLSEVKIVPEKLSQLQINIIRSHAAGVGNPLSPERVKRLLVLRINVIAKGYSGVSPKTLRDVISFCNAGCLSKVPEQGTVGASGDLAPLSHLILGMMGEGEMWDPDLKTWDSAKTVIKRFNLPLLNLQAKEGVALINGTQFITSLGAEAIFRAENLVPCADILTSISLEALNGTVKAFFPEIHLPRPHPGQEISARNIRSLLHSSVFPSDIAKSHENCNKVQDAYSLRCASQVHGPVYDTLDFAKRIIETEMNSATDNPLVLIDSKCIISGGNFHGEYPGKALDFLAIVVHELGSISERRIERLVNGSLSGLPAFLVEDGGLNSGFMMAQTTAASLVSENKTLCHPATVDSISTNAAKEDHVSMGGWAARKCLQVIENVEIILAIELLTSTQGLELRRPLRSTNPIEKIFQLVRDAGIAFLKEDRFLTPDIEIAASLIRKRQIFCLIKPYWEMWNHLDPKNNYKFVMKL